MDSSLTLDGETNLKPDSHQWKQYKFIYPNEEVYQKVCSCVKLPACCEPVLGDDRTFMVLLSGKAGKVRKLFQDKILELRDPYCTNIRRKRTRPDEKPDKVQKKPKHRRRLTFLEELEKFQMKLSDQDQPRSSQFRLVNRFIAAIDEKDPKMKKQHLDQLGTFIRVGVLQVDALDCNGINRLFPALSIEHRTMILRIIQKDENYRLLQKLCEAPKEEEEEDGEEEEEEDGEEKGEEKGGEKEEEEKKKKKKKKKKKNRRKMNKKEEGTASVLYIGGGDTLDNHFLQIESSDDSILYIRIPDTYRETFSKIKWKLPIFELSELEDLFPRLMWNNGRPTLGTDKCMHIITTCCKLNYLRKESIGPLLERSCVFGCFFFFVLLSDSRFLFFFFFCVCYMIRLFNILGISMNIMKFAQPQDIQRYNLPGELELRDFIRTVGRLYLLPFALVAFYFNNYAKTEPMLNELGMLFD